jgi:hypothetical protein
MVKVVKKVNSDKYFHTEGVVFNLYWICHFEFNS